ncbi:hypothetical protein [Klebsiella michiganensis]|uniref:hypothetical protein n=1 Tax=Klebsiella michiganensis TaxID=1134687 RepID=UPI0038905998
MVPMALAMLAEAPQRTARDAGDAAASSNPAVAASAKATKATRKSPTRKTAARKTTEKRRLPPKNNRLAPRALAARAEICNAWRLLFSVRSPPPIQEMTR